MSAANRKSLAAHEHQQVPGSRKEAGTRGDVHWRPAIAIRHTKDAKAILLNQSFDCANVTVSGSRVRWKELFDPRGGTHFDAIDANGGTDPHHAKGQHEGDDTVDCLVPALLRALSPGKA